MTSPLRTTGRKRELVVSDPLREVVQRPIDVLELHLGRRNLDVLAGFERFTNLEVLWVNDNNLTKISGLENNFRLKRLQAQNNRISRLGDGIRALRYLEILALAGNRVRDLRDLLEDLRFLPFLRELDLSGNPVSEEDRFRLYVIAVSPKLEVLNCKTITDLERDAARYVKLENVMSPRERAAPRRVPVAPSLAFGRSYSPPPRSRSAQPLWANISPCTRDLIREVSERRMAQQRAEAEAREAAAAAEAVAARERSVRSAPIPPALDFRARWPRPPPPPEPTPVRQLLATLPARSSSAQRGALVPAAGAETDPDATIRLSRGLRLRVGDVEERARAVQVARAPRASFVYSPHLPAAVAATGSGLSSA